MVYSVKNLDKDWFWYPQSAVFCSYGSPDLFKKVKLDNEFGQYIARTIFSLEYDELITLIKQAKKIFHERYNKIVFESMTRAFEEF